MAKRILTYIDGHEPRSEAIVPVVGALARDAGSTVRLLREFPEPTRVVGDSGRTVAYVDQEMARLTAEGLAELQRTEVELNGVPVETVVRFGEPVDEIVHEADAFDAEVIALTERPRGWLRRLLGGSTAARVARHAHVPTLILTTPAA